ncbi:MAG: class I SAM-dependent methyltransferase [Nitrospirota bacterium]
MLNLFRKNKTPRYKKYVGPVDQYDFMGATQFRLLCTLGLRANNYMLDFGCGSLRAGRFFISYLDKGRYFGIEPNKWLIKEGIKHNTGRDILKLKKPRFDYNSDFRTDVFGTKFDFIVAQSIFSHTGNDIISGILKNFKDSLNPGGIIAVTFFEADSDFEGNGWVYPGCARYKRTTVKKFFDDAGVYALRIPWYHPRQTWYLISNDKSRLPRDDMFQHLSGAVLFDPEFAESLKN